MHIDNLSFKKLILTSIASFAICANALLAQAPTTNVSPNADQNGGQNVSAEWHVKLEAAEKAFLDGHYANSEKLREEALAATTDEASRATVLNQIGVIQMRHKHFVDAQRSFSSAYELRKKASGENNELTLQSLSNLALVTFKLGDEKKAEELYKQCIEGKRKVQPNTASLASTLANLAHLYSDLRRLDDARKLYLEAIEIDSKVLGEKHAEVAADYFNLGALEHRGNRFDEALISFQKAHDLYAALGEKHGMIKSLHYMSLCHHALNNHDKAATSALQAHKLHEEHKGKEHPDTLVHLMNAADALDAAGKSDEAEKLYKQALSTAQHESRASNLNLAETNLELAQYYKRHGDKDSAEHHFKAALLHYDHLSKKEKRTLYELPLSYSKMLAELKRTAESEHLARKYLHVYAPDEVRQ
jgi:tetratricopeptide (TPR) repeat protein